MTELEHLVLRRDRSEIEQAGLWLVEHLRPEGLKQCFASYALEVAQQQRVRH